MKNLFKKVIAGASMTLPMLALAQVSAPRTARPQTGVRSISDINRIIETVINWITGLFFAVAILFIFWAAYSYMTAAGNPEKLGEAKNRLIYAIVAIAIALLATSVEFIIREVLG